SGGVGAARSQPALHPHLPARTSGRGPRRDARPSRRVPESTGGSMTLDTISPARRQSPARERRPRIGFLGAGWIGAHRMEAMLAAGQVEAVGIADPAADRLDAVAALAPHA